MSYNKIYDDHLKDIVTQLTRIANTLEGNFGESARVKPVVKPAVESVEFTAEALENTIRKVMGREEQVHSIDIRNSVIYKGGEYHVSVMIQDAPSPPPFARDALYENCGTFDDRKEAVDAYITSQEVLNHNTLTPATVPVYEVIERPANALEYRRI